VGSLVVPGAEHQAEACARGEPKLSDLVPRDCELVGIDRPIESDGVPRALDRPRRPLPAQGAREIVAARDAGGEEPPAFALTARTEVEGVLVVGIGDRVEAVRDAVGRRREVVPVARDIESDVQPIAPEVNMFLWISAIDVRHIGEAPAGELLQELLVRRGRIRSRRLQSYVPSCRSDQLVSRRIPRTPMRS